MSVRRWAWYGYNTAAALGLALFVYRMISGTLPGSF